MDYYSAKREVEKIPRTKLERHAALRMEAAAVAHRMGLMHGALRTVLGGESAITTLLYEASNVITKLTAELKVA